MKFVKYCNVIGMCTHSVMPLKDHSTCNNYPLQVSTKLQRILEIWSAGYGVVSLQLFHNMTASEAFTREACIIEAIGKGLAGEIVCVCVCVCGWIVMCSV